MTTRTRILAIVPAVLGLALGITVAVLPHHGPAGHARPAAGQVVPASTTGVPFVPAVDLTQLHWQDFRGYRLPVSAHDGPRDTADGLASGYSDSPLGALLAVINISARTAWQFGPAIYGPTIQAQVSGPSQQQMLTADQDAYTEGAAQIPDIRAYATIPAFAWARYTPADATIDLVAAGPDGNGGRFYVATQIDAQWADGDWRIVAPPGGDWGNTAAPISSLAGYTTFPGQE